MISCRISYIFFTYDASIYNNWEFEFNFTRPVNASSGSSPQVQAVAAAFVQDINGEELRITGDMSSPGITFSGNGRDGYFFDIDSGYLEKGLPELPFTGLEADHEGFAGWDADGSGPEPQAYGHTFTWNGITWWMAYYVASRDYDNIDPDPDAALGHFTDAGTGFPNLEIQLAYRGYTIDQLKLKAGYATLGNDIFGVDWWTDSANSIHHYHHYGYNLTFEIDGFPIMKYVMDTAFSTQNVGYINYDWESYSRQFHLNGHFGKCTGQCQACCRFIPERPGWTLHEDIYRR